MRDTSINAIVIILCLWLSTSGCAAIDSSQQLILLKTLSQNQARMNSYVARQEALFYKLEKHLAAGKIRVGISQEAVRRTYGEPITSFLSREKYPGTEVLLYRHPIRYFSSPRIYLYFDAKGKLVASERLL